MSSVTVIRPAFDPLVDVPELAAGRRFDFAKQTGLGTSGFQVLSEPAGDTLAQASVGEQPVSDAARGERVLRAPDTNTSMIVSAPSAALRGTGVVVYAFWLTTSTSAASFETIFQVRDGTQPTQFRCLFQRRNNRYLFELFLSTSGTSTGEGTYRYTVPDDITPKYCQLIIDTNNANPVMRARLFVNRVEIGLQAAPTNVTQGTYFASTAPLRLMNNQFSNTGQLGLLGPTFDVLNGMPTQQDLDLMYCTRALVEPVLPSFQLLCDGNSITQSLGVDGSALQTAGYPHQLSLLLGRKWAVTAIGEGGKRTDQLVTDAPGKLVPRVDLRKARSFVLMFENLNYITFGATVQQAYDAVRAYAVIAVAAGLDVIAATAPATNTSQPGLGTLGQLNQMIRDTWTQYAVALVDFEVCPSLVPAGSTLNPTNWFDATHPKELGYLGMAQFAAPILQALVA